MQGKVSLSCFNADIQYITKVHRRYTATADSKCPLSLVSVTNFVMVFINGGMSYISIRLLTFITYVCMYIVYFLSIYGNGQLSKKNSTPRRYYRNATNFECHIFYGNWQKGTIGN